MAFYSKLTEIEIQTSYFNTEGEARDMAVALYNGATFASAARFSPRFDELDNPSNIPGDFISSTSGNPFTRAVFKEQMLSDLEEGILVTDRKFGSARTQTIFDEVLTELTGMTTNLSAYPYLIDFATEHLVRVDNDDDIQAEERLSTADLKDRAQRWLCKEYPGTLVPNATEFNNFISKYFGVSQKRNGTMTWLNLKFVSDEVAMLKYELKMRDKEIAALEAEVARLKEQESMIKALLNA